MTFIKRKRIGKLLVTAMVALTVALGSAPSALAATSIGNGTLGSENGNVLIFACDNNSEVRVELCTPRTVRVRLSQSGSAGYRPADPQYYMVQKNEWPAVERTVVSEGDSVKIVTSAMELRIQKTPFRIAMYDLDGNLMTKDTDAVGMYVNGSQVGVRKEEGTLNAGGIFGFGSGDHGRRAELNRYDRDFNEFSMSHGRLIAPFFMSTVGYGIFLNTIEKNTTFFKRGGGFETTGYLDYFMMYGPDFKTILNEYAEITGRMELYGKWAHGFMLSKYGNDNATQAEFLQWLHRLRDEGYPTDCYVFDYGWRGDVADNGGNQTGAGEKWGKQMWSNDISKFPDLEAMFREADELGFHVGLHNNAGTPEASGGDKLYLPENEAKWVKSYMDSVITTGYGDWFWPDEFDVLGSNTAPVLSSKGAFEAWQEYTEDSRPMFITRGSYAGQHYATAWSGDINNTSEELLNQVGFSIDAGLVGYWTVSHDLGGFMKRPSDELYTRWVSEFGAWNGIMRAHGHDGREPWTFSKTAQDTLKQNLKIRYSLYPYIYSSAWQGYSAGVPIMRAMILEDGSQYNADAYGLNKQYYYGDWFLVAPAADTADTVVSVWLPPETVWYNYYTGERYEGGASGKTVRVAAALEEIPVFVKAGAIVPMGPDVDYADEKPLDPLTLDIYPRGTTSYTLYEDDGVSRRYITENAYSTTTYTCVQSGKDISFKIGARVDGNSAAFTPAARSYNLKFNHIGTVRGVTLDGCSLAKLESVGAYNAAEEGFYLDETGKTLYVKLRDNGKERNIVLDSEGVEEPELGDEDEGYPPQRITSGDRAELENSSFTSAAGACEARSERKGFTGSGYAYIPVGAGNAVDLDVNIIRAGTYDLSLRVNCGKSSLNDTSRTAELYLGDKKINLSFDCTAWTSGGNGDWREIQISGVTLDAGIMHIKVLAAGAAPGGYELDSLAFTRRDTSVDAFSEISADSAAFLSGMTKVTEGGTTAIRAVADGDWAQFNELVGIHRGGLSVRVKSSSGGSIIVYENGVGDKILATVELPSDGQWHDIEVNCKDVDLDGSNVYFEFKAGEGGMDAELSSFRFIRKVPAYAEHQAINADVRSGINIRDGKLVNIENGDYAVYRDMDFAGGGLKTVSLSAATINGGGRAELYIDSMTSANLIATVYIGSTDSWSNRRTFTVSAKDVSGVHDVYVKFVYGESKSICDLYTISFGTRAVTVKGVVAGGTADLLISDDTALPGETVTVQVYGVEAGKELSSLAVADAGGAAVEVSSNNGKYAFVLPESVPVTVTATLGEKLPRLTAGATLELEEGSGNSDGGRLRVDREWQGYSGSGYVAGWKTVGSYAELKVNVPEKGRFIFTVRGAAGKKNDPAYDSSPRSGSVYVDEKYLCSFSIAISDSWSVWSESELEQSVYLAAGVHRLKITAEGDNPGNFNIDCIKVAQVLDTADLSAAIDRARALELDGFTEESKAALATAIEAAETALAKPNATQQELNAAENELLGAIEGLTEKQPDPPATDDGEDGGANLGLAIGLPLGLAVAAAVAAAAAVAVKKKKRSGGAKKEPQPETGEQDAETAREETEAEATAEEAESVEVGDGGESNAEENKD